MKKKQKAVTSATAPLGKLKDTDITEADIKKEYEKIEAANNKLKEMREKIALASANLPKLRVKEITRTLHSDGILQGEQVVNLVFDKDSELLSIPEIESRVMDRSGKGCKMLHITGDFLKQDRREMLALVEYFPDYYTTMWMDGESIINDVRPPFGHVMVPFGKINKRNLVLFQRNDEILFRIGTEEDYEAFMAFYKENFKNLTVAGTKLIAIPTTPEFIVKLQKYIVKDDLRVRYSFPLNELIT